VVQQGARQEQAKSAGQWLSGEIDNLRKKVAGSRIPRRGLSLEIEPVRRHQQHHALQQQMGELNTQLNNARALSPTRSRKRG